MTSSIFLVNLLANRQKHRRSVVTVVPPVATHAPPAPTLMTAVGDGPEDEDEDDDVHDDADIDDTGRRGGATNTGDRAWDRIRIVADRHIRLAASNDIVQRGAVEYTEFLNLWLQEGLSRFVLQQKSKKS